MTDYTRQPLFKKATTRQQSSYWNGSRSSSSIPEDALLTEDGNPILTEAGQYILTES